MHVLGSCFFFQAEDGIRDHCVTGVQTCALPISGVGDQAEGLRSRTGSSKPFSLISDSSMTVRSPAPRCVLATTVSAAMARSEEGRGGEKGRYRWVPDH